MCEMLRVALLGTCSATLGEGPKLKMIAETSKMIKTIGAAPDVVKLFSSTNFIGIFVIGTSKGQCKHKDSALLVRFVFSPYYTSVSLNNIFVNKQDQTCSSI